MGKQLSLGDDEEPSKRKKKPNPRPATYRSRLVEGERQRAKRMVDRVRSQMKRRV